MVTDTIDNADLYKVLGERFAAGLEFLKRKDLATLPLGKMEILGSDCFALIQEYDSRTKAMSKWEAHRVHADIQFVVSGKEYIGYAPINTVTVTNEYNAKDDYLLGTAEGTYVKMSPGMFTILWPQDAHSPGVAQNDQPEKLRKVVVKVKLT
jgi:biofilm protein TabA